MTSQQSGRRAIHDDDSLVVGDLVEVGPGSSLVVAYDEKRKNIVRIEENSKITLQTLESAKILMDQGGIFAKLKALPKGSEFQVETPTAIASVRGSEFLTRASADGFTRIFNFSDSSVFVYSFDAKGKRNDSPMVLKNTEKTEVAHTGESPKASQKMSDEELASGKTFESALDILTAKADKSDEGKEDASASAGASKENAEDVLNEMAKFYESKEITAFMARVSDDYGYRGELEEFLRRDFRDYDSIHLNLFIKQTEKTPTGARVRADWQLQFFPTAISQQIAVRGSNLDFIFTDDRGKLKLKAQRGANPLFGARSPEIAAQSGAPSSVTRALETIEDSGSRAAKQSAATVVAQSSEGSSGQTTPVNFQLLNPKVLNTGTGNTFPISSPPINIVKLQMDVRLADNPPVADLLGVKMEVTDSRTGIVLHAMGDLHAGQTTTFLTTDTITFGTIGQSGTFTFVLDPDHQFTLIDRSTTRDAESYTSA